MRLIINVHVIIRPFMVKGLLFFMFISLVICLSSIPRLMFAESNTRNTDSLELVLKKNITPKERAATLLLLSQENIAVNRTKALECALKAYEISEKSDDEAGKLQSMLKLSWLYYN